MKMNLLYATKHRGIYKKKYGEDALDGGFYDILGT